ncbi:MAG: undecaprenyl-phosphate glucose phosphotransferase [Prevotella sp.]|jgi:putative colanic acid biosynthesis UDP-glucose lipid carrier transferase|nr:undecaprenyl-phosphate glucose phosphotransferase [Prevotella sp.]
MEMLAKRRGYGHFIKWVVRLSDLLVINFLFAVLYFFFRDFFFQCAYLQKSVIGEMFLWVNFSYFIVISAIDDNISSNIIYFDKIVQKALSFITLYTIVLFVGMTMFGIVDFSWTSWVIIYLLLAALYTTWHVLFRIIIKLYRRKGYNFKTVVIVGSGLNGLDVYADLDSKDYGYKILGIFDDNVGLKKTLPNYIGKLSDVEQFCFDHHVDEIYCTLPGSQEIKILQLLNFAEKHMIRFYLVPEFYKYIKRSLVLDFLQTVPVIGIRREPLELLYNQMAKRAFDIIFASLVLITVFPLMYIVLGSIIKLTSRGPVFFKQKRTGLQGKVFDCYKFRSMALNDAADSVATVKNDPRITTVGAFMRKTSIDEFPQFINVLKGDMSVVGPRPHMIRQTQLYTGLIDKFMIRHLVKPGITGWAQISGYRGETKMITQMEGRFKKDVWYLENWTFFLDLKIIFVTVLNLFRGEDNAY